MDIIKGGWHPSGDKEIHRKTWKSDLKGIVSRKDDGAIRAQNHVSAPLSTLQDPDSFGPPPKHSAFYPDANAASKTKRITAGGEQEKPAPTPFRVNTTGLTTDNLPKPPVRREAPPPPGAAAKARPVPQIPTASSSSVRPVPAIPSRTGPPPGLPPRQSENPSEFEPAPPPTYGEALEPASTSAAINRLGQAGVSIPGFGIGGSAGTSTGQTDQVNELQQRFARMKAARETGDEAQNAAPSWKQAQNAYTDAQASPSSPSFADAQSAFGAIAQKKRPPPPPAKKIGLTTEAESAPPPIPMSSKPRPG